MAPVLVHDPSIAENIVRKCNIKHHHVSLQRNICTTGLDIKQFGPLAQGASRFEKSLAQGPVDFASHWPTNLRHRQHAHSLRQNRSHGKSCNSVHCLLYNTHISFTSSLLLVITIIYIIPSSASAGVESCLANLAKDQNFL